MRTRLNKLLLIPHFTHTHTHSVQKASIGHNQVLKELPVTIRNSRLDAALLCELERQTNTPEKMDFLGLSS